MIRSLRAASHAAVEAFFNVLEQERNERQRRTPVRAPSQPSGEVSELDREKAKRMLRLSEGNR